MTYQNLGYWVGQANDLSTGNHPTGWTNGQRWSETASEWQTMFNTEYSSARDTSVGQPGKPSGNQHPTGWVSGQLWSVTATQWNGMWGTEWTNARDNSAGQSGNGLAAQHPTGWVAGQQWSATAQQWCEMWGIEWRAARDPQGFPYSYPGQPANGVYWKNTAELWKGQADYYWGPAEAWNTGSTYKALYQAYVGYYNDMVAQRDYWINAAHNDPNVWTNQYNAGDAAAQAAYRPPGIRSYDVGFANKNVQKNLWTQVGVFYAPVTGHYFLYWYATITGYDSGYNSGNRGRLRLSSPNNGLLEGRNAGLKPDNNTADTMLAVGALVFMGAGQGVGFDAYIEAPNESFGRNVVDNVAQIKFVPEYSYPK